MKYTQGKGLMTFSWQPIKEHTQGPTPQDWYLIMESSKRLELEDWALSLQDFGPPFSHL